MFVNRLKRLEYPIDQNDRTLVLTAALLHDIGHGPFSHAFERITGEDHEVWTDRLITDEQTQVNAVLRGYDDHLPTALQGFFDQDTILTRIVSSQLDADRCDYLLRDSHATGTEYGKFDLTWLIEHLYLDQPRQRLYLGRKALDVAEEYIHARYHMYRAVYFHKTIRAAEVMLRLMMKRYKELLLAANSDAAKRAIVPDSPQSVTRAFSAPPNLHDYVALDDYSVTEFLKACKNSGDTILRSLGEGLAERRLYKSTDVSGFMQNRVADFVRDSEGAVRTAGLDREYALPVDTLADTPYKPYDPDEDRPATQIYVEDQDGVSKEISTISGPVNELRKKYTMIRYCYPIGVQGSIEGIADRTLRGG
jgi:HD superfamily phosphohydrolase